MTDARSDAAQEKVMQPSGALLAMPLLIMNMGGEMIYVLHQRLSAQAIDPSKSKKGDVVMTMCARKFIAELFKPQALYSSTSVRKIFNSLAHSSIMRLNTASMDKLYDLMCMGFKYQILSCASPDMLVQVTLNHLMSLRALTDVPTVHDLIGDVLRHVMTTYGQLDMAAFFQIKQSLLLFFQDKRVKVSLFLHEKIQNMNGSFVLNTSGIVGTGATIPGTMRYFDANGLENEKQTIEMKSAENAKYNYGATILEQDLADCPYGLNLYDPHKEALTDTSSVSEALAKNTSGSPSSRNAAKKISQAPSYSVSASEEMNLLASLITGGGGGALAKDQDVGFKLNLFPDDDGDSSGTQDERVIRTIHINGAQAERKSELVNLLHDLDDDDERERGAKGVDSRAQEKKSSQEDEDDVDLLALMDST